jgi:hypothetical protein
MAVNPSAARRRDARRAGAKADDYEYDRAEMPYKNLRCEKLGSCGGVWEGRAVSVLGPPPEERREDEYHCWLCNARLRCHKREWTRPSWGRAVTHSRNLTSRPAELAYVVPRPPNDSYSTTLTEDATGKYTHVVFRKTVTMPPTHLDMNIYSCPCGCDEDDELRALLAAHEHTGPRGSPNYRR